jgi:hypothetical protein
MTIKQCTKSALNEIKKHILGKSFLFLTSLMADCEAYFTALLEPQKLIAIVYNPKNSREKHENGSLRF